MSESFYKNIVADMPVGFLKIKPDGIIVETNRVLNRISGYSDDELVGHIIYDLPVTPFNDVLFDLIASCILNNSSFGRLLVRCKNCELITTDVYMSMYEEYGEPFITIMLINVTKEVKHLEELELNNSIFAEMIDNSHRGLCIEDNYQNITSVNQKLLTYLKIGGTPETYIGKKNYLIHNEFSKFLNNPDEYFQFQNECIQSKKGYLNFELELNDGRFYKLTYEPVWHKSEIIAHIWFYNDVTVETNAKREVATQRILYDEVIEGIPIETAVFEAKDLRILHINKQAIVNQELRSWMKDKKLSEYSLASSELKNQMLIKEKKLRQCVDEKKVIVYDEVVKDEKGNEHFYKRYATPHIINGEVKYVSEFGVDLSDIKLTETKLINTQIQLLSLIESSHSHIWSVDTESRFVYSNSTFQKVLKEGFNIDLKPGYYLPDSFTDPIIKTEWEGYYKRVLSGEFFSITRVYPLPTAGFTMEYSFKPIFNHQNEIVGATVFGYNLTELSNIQRELIKTQSNLVGLINTERALIWSLDTELNITFCNNKFKSLLTKVLGRKFEMGTHILFKEFGDDVIDFWKQSYLRSLAGEEITFTYTWSDNNTYDFNIKPIRNQENEIFGLSVFAYDITEIQKVTKRLSESETQLNALVSSLDDIVFELELDGRFKNVWLSNESYLAIPKEEFIGLRIDEIPWLYDAIGGIRFQTAFDQCIYYFETKYFEYFMMGKTFQAKINPIYIDKVIAGVSLLIKDITDKKNQEKLLAESEAKYRLISDQMVDLISVHDMQGNMLFVSNSFNTMLGYNVEELIGINALEIIYPEDHHQITESLRYLSAENKTDIREFRIVKKDGSLIEVEGRAKIIIEDGSIVGVQVTSRDISERKRAEEAIKQALNKEKALNEMKTKLVSTVSHEFRTPMSTIRSSAELIEMYIGKDIQQYEDKIETHITIIKEEIERIVGLMNDVLYLSKEDSSKSSFKPERFNLLELCTKIIDINFSNDKLGRRVTLIAEEQHYPFYGDKNLITYSLFNLLNNAFKYSLDEANIELHLRIENEKIELALSDTGIGIPEEDMPHLFNRFYRGKNTDGIQGTGLGLVIVKTFVERNNGNIYLESTLNKGTTVTIELPLEQMTIIN